MNVELVGHATIAIKSDNFTMLCDPWLVGGFCGSAMIWQYPPRIKGIEDFKKIDCMYISHDHFDHMNIETLKKIDKNIPIYMFNFHDNKNLLINLKDLGFQNINICEPWKKVNINSDTSITIFPSDLEYADSSALITHKGFNVYHGNDNMLNADTYKKISKLCKVDLAFMPYCGLSGFPSAYEFDKNLKDELATKKRNETLKKFYDCVVALDPKKAVPAAGDLCIITKDTLWANYYDRSSPIEAVNEAPKNLQDVIIDMKPNDTFYQEEGLVRFESKEKWDYNAEDQNKFSQLNHVKSEVDKLENWLHFEDVDNEQFKQNVKKYFQLGLEKYKDLAKLVGDYTFVINMDNGKNLNYSLTIDFKTMKIIENSTENYNKRIKIRPEIFCKIMKRNIQWSEAYAALKMKLDRKPYNNYNLKFWKWLYCLDAMQDFSYN